MRCESRYDKNHSGRTETERKKWAPRPTMIGLCWKKCEIRSGVALRCLAVLCYPSLRWEVSVVSPENKSSRLVGERSGLGKRGSRTSLDSSAYPTLNQAITILRILGQASIPWYPVTLITDLSSITWCLSVGQALKKVDRTLFADLGKVVR
jgi:hypothetical protein